MKHFITILAVLAASAAHAGKHQPTPAPSGITSQSCATAAAAALATGGTAWAQGGRGGAGGAGGLGLGGTGGSNTLGNVMAGGVDLAGARIGSDLNVERSAPSLFGATPTQPTQPCARPGFTIGGSSRDGSGLLSIPTGTDVTCRVDNALTIMARNPKLFSDDDRLTVSCKQEDIAETEACKELARRKADAARAAAALEDRPQRQATAAVPGLLP